MFDIHDLHRDEWMLKGSFAKHGYDWWWHSFTARKASTGEEVPFFIEFFTINPKLDNGKPRFGQLGDTPSYLMIKAGCWGKSKIQLHRFFSFSEAKIHGKAPYSVEAGDCFASENALRGHIAISKEEKDAHPEWMCDAGEIAFDLSVEKKNAFHVGYGANALFRALKAFEMYWHAEGMKSLYEGKITLNGEEYIVSKENSYGYADKNWGKNFTSPWVWLASSHLYSTKLNRELKDSCFDIGGGRPKAFGIPFSRKLLGVTRYEGEQGYEFNFAKFWMGVKTVFSFEEKESVVHWHVEQHNRHHKQITDIECEKDDMLFVNYEDPAGKKRFSRLWNGGNGKGEIKLFEKRKKEWVEVDILQASNIGCEYGEFDPKEQ